MSVSQELITTHFLLDIFKFVAFTAAVAFDFTFAGANNQYRVY